VPVIQTFLQYLKVNRKELLLQVLVRKEWRLRSSTTKLNCLRVELGLFVAQGNESLDAKGHQVVNAAPANVEAGGAAST